MGKESYDLGASGEKQAVEYLTRKGFKIIESNFRSQQGEIDLVAQDGEFLVFVEVKNYSYRSLGSSLGAIGKAKRQALIHAAKTYLYKNEIKDTNCRFDVVTIYREQGGQTFINHIKNAFYVN